MMAIGTEFDSYNAFLAVFDSFQVESQLKYSVGTSRLLKSTAENPIEPHVIERFKYAYRRYKCTKCTAGLSLKLIEINGNYKLRISAFQVTHEHEQDPLNLDGRAHLYENLDAIKDIVSKMPKENVPFAEHLIENLLHILKNCPENYVAEQYIKTGKIFQVLHREFLNIFRNFLFFLKHFNTLNNIYFVDLLVAQKIQPTITTTTFHNQQPPHQNAKIVKMIFWWMRLN